MCPDIRETDYAYWAQRAVQASVFPEYAGAFAFLLRDWAVGERLTQIGPLVEAAPRWLDDVLTTFLVEQARTGYVPGTGSLAAERIAKALAETGGARSANALYDVGSLQMYSRFALAARAYLQACVTLREALHQAHPEHLDIAIDLRTALTSLGSLLRGTGRVEEAEAAYHRTVALGEALYAANPEHVEIANDLGRALNNLGVLLRGTGRVEEAEAAYRRTVALGEALYAANPEHVDIKVGYATSLCAVGQFVEARRLVDEVLALMPEHPYANQLRRYVAQQQQSLPPDTTKVTLASVAHPRANPAEAVRLNMQYQQDLARWQALSWWKRRRVPKPTPPTGI